MADIIERFSYCFSTYSNDALNLPCVFTAAMGYGLASTCIRPRCQIPPALHFIICLRPTTGPIKSPSTYVRGQSRQLSVQQQTHAYLVTFTSTTEDAALLRLSVRSDLAAVYLFICSFYVSCEACSLTLEAANSRPRRLMNFTRPVLRTRNGSSYSSY